MPAALAHQERHLAPGSVHAEYLPAGTLLVCTDGTLALDLPAITLTEHTLRPRLQLAAGETCQLEHAGWVSCSARASASLHVVAPAAAPAMLASLLASVARRLARVLQIRGHRRHPAKPA